MVEATLRTDDELMVSLGQGDGASLGELMGRYERPLVGYLTGIVNDVERARDLAQETFIRVFRHAGGYRTSSRFTTFIASCDVRVWTCGRPASRSMYRTSNAEASAVTTRSR